MIKVRCVCMMYLSSRYKEKKSSVQMSRGKREVYDSERILSMDWFKKSFLDERSALGKREAIASLAVLKKKKNKLIRIAPLPYKNTSHSLFRNTHQILCAQIIPQSLEQFLVCRIIIHTRRREWIHTRSKRECRHRSLL